MEKELVLQKLALLMIDDYFNDAILSFCKKESIAFDCERSCYVGKYDIVNRQEPDGSFGQDIVFYFKEEGVYSYHEICFDLEKFISDFQTFLIFLKKRRFHAKVINLFIGMKKKYIFTHSHQKIS